MKISTKRLVLAIALALTSAAHAATSTILHDGITKFSGKYKIEDTKINKHVGADGRVNVMVVLQDEPAVMAYQRGLVAAGGRGVTAATVAGAASRQSVSQLSSKQVQFLGSVGSRGIGYDELFRAQRVVNGVAMRVAPADMARLAKLPGVARVEYLPYETLSNITSVPFINAPQLWTAKTSLGLISDAIGTGVRVGIIDTGIDYQHPDFGGTGSLIDYQKNGDRRHINPVNPEDPNSPKYFPTAKVVGGIDFVGDAYDGANTPVQDPNPMDCNGHGSHVAGTAAGYGVKNDGTAYTAGYDPLPNYSGLRIGPGVAPGADLYALRVFGCGGGTSVLTEAIEWATDPNNDGDLSDHLDVINMSLGSPEGFPSDIDAAAADNAALTGMIVVAAAGNDGDAFFVHGSPAAGKHVIAAAAIVDAGIPGVLLHETAPAATDYLAAAGVFTNPDNTPSPPPSGQSGEVVLVDDGMDTTSDACESAFVSDVAGKFALIDRGNCDFTNKVLNAQLNGAIGVIVANYTGDTAPLIMGGPAYTAITIPAIGVSLDTGNILKSQLTSGAVTIALAVANAGDTFAAFSSRGPAGDSDGSITLKPDIAAPGLNIPSVQSGVTCDEIAATGCISPASGGYIPGGRLLVLSGTSMATPHITGMMAIMRELHPDFSADEIKALAMNTAAHDVTLGANGLGPRFGARSVGAGRVDVALAATGNITAFNNDVDGVTAVTFDLEPTESGVFPHTVRIVNHTNLEQVVDLSIDTINDAPGVSFSIAGPPTITLPAFGSTVIKIAMTTDVSKMKRFRDPTIGTTSSVFDFTVAREYLAEESSLLKISKAGAELARLPLYAALRPHSSLTTTGMPNGAPASGTTNLTLTGQDVCTGTRRVEEPGCVADYLSDEVSLVSPFELQVTAARDTSLPGFANLHYAGVNYTVGADGGIYLFGIAAYGKWGSPSVVSYNICIDTNHDGLYDQVLFNTDTGSIGPLFGQPAIPTDGYFSALSDLNYAYFEYPLNFFGAGFVDTAVLDNNVMMMGVTAAHLGVAALAKINYGIAVCPGGDPLCTRFTLPSKRCTAGDALATFNGPYTYDPAHPGVDGFGDVLHQDLNGATLAVPYDTANLSANGSSGMLLLHHHNTSDKTAEVVVFDELFKDSFDGQ